MITSAVRNLRVIFAAAFLNGTHGAMTRAQLQLFVLSLSSYMPFVALVDGVANSLGPSLVQVGGGWLADRAGRRLPLIMGSVLVLLSGAAFLGAVYWGSPVVALGAAALLGAGTMGAPAREALLAESTDTMRRRDAFNILAVCAAAPGVFAAAVAGWLVIRTRGFGVVFEVMIVLEAIVLALYVFLLRESVKGRLADHLHPDRFREFLRHVVSIDPRLRAFLVLIAIDGFLWGIGYKILWGMLKASERLTAGEIGLLASVSIASWVVFKSPVGWAMSRWGCRACLVISEICGGLGLIGVIVVRGQGVLPLVPCVMLTGLIPAFWVPAVRVLMVNSVGQEQRAEGLGKLALFTGASGFVGGIVGGLLYQASSIVVPLAVNAVGAAAMVVALLLFVRESPQNEIR